MPALTPAQIVEAVTNALDESGASAVLLSQPQGNPRRFLVQFGTTTFELWTYIWSLRHGGGAARPKNEYRIQITGIKSPLQINPYGPTLLLGYEENLRCFAGFDLNKHRVFSKNSPSIQSPITTLNDALQYGFSFTRKGNDEIAIGIRSDQFLAYCLNAAILHREGANAQMVDLLTRASALDVISEAEVGQVAPERERILREVSKLSRDSSFRRKILHAYDHRCAVTRVQLRLIDAAHILPVGVEGSTDEITNGICLSPTYHRAFDRALIYLDESLQMQINPAKEQDLVASGLAGGLDYFKTYLGMRIHLPADRAWWPRLETIREANKVRGIN